MSNKLLRTLFSGTMLGMGIFFLLHAQGAGSEAGVGDSFSPMFYPRIILWCWVGLSAAMVLQSLFFLGAAHVLRINWTPLLSSVVLIGVVCTLMAEVGFLPVCMGFMLTAPVCLGFRKPLPLVLTAVLFSVGVWYIFNTFLGISLPEVPFSSSALL